MARQVELDSLGSCVPVEAQPVYRSCHTGLQQEVGELNSHAGLDHCSRNPVAEMSSSAGDRNDQEEGKCIDLGCAGRFPVEGQHTDPNGVGTLQVEKCIDSGCANTDHAALDNLLDRGKVADNLAVVESCSHVP